MLAQTYDTVSDSQFANGKRLVEQLGVGVGQRVLDIGCGTGRLAFHVLERIGPRGELIGIDPLPERIAIADGRRIAPRMPTSMSGWRKSWAWWRAAASMWSI